MELHHKCFEIFGEGNKSVKISDASQIQILVNGKPNGATLHDVFRKIDDLSTNKIYGWSILEFYEVENGYLKDREGNKISLLYGDQQIFFKRVKDPLIILDEKNVTLNYIRDVSTLLGLKKIEETITAIDDDDKKILIQERRRLEAEKEWREKEKERREKERLEAEQKEKERREKERLEAEQKEKERLEAEQKEKERLEAEQKENIFSPKEFRSIRKYYTENGFVEYSTPDDKYILFFGENNDEEPFLIARRENYYEELEGNLSENTEKIVEFEFKEGGEEKVVVLNKKTGEIKVEIIA